VHDVSHNANVGDGWERSGQTSKGDLVGLGAIIRNWKRRSSCLTGIGSTRSEVASVPSKTASAGADKAGSRGGAVTSIGAGIGEAGIKVADGDSPSLNFSLAGAKVLDHKRPDAIWA
jgi:hypothetical protein